MNYLDLSSPGFPSHASPAPSAASVETKPGGEWQVGKLPRRLIEHNGTERAAVEAFIGERFEQTFGARINAFMPRLFSMRDRNDRITGAFGLRSTSCRLFVEQYLDEPIDHAIASHCGERIERRGIVEVGHLCGTFPGAARIMIILLIVRLHREGFQWVAFTGTTGLRNAFAHLGMFPIALQPARIESLPAESRAAWGHYYEHSPEVLVGRIRDGMLLLASRVPGGARL